MIELIPFVLLIIIGAVVTLLLSELSRQSSGRAVSKYDHPPDFNYRPARFNPGRNPQKSELLNLLHGDQETAIRLILHARQNNPGQTESWCIEKVISDLLRDRR